MGLYHKYRPKKLKQVYGQSDAVRTIAQWLKSGRVPHAVLFTGPSGCGKTTLARILKDAMCCGDSDFQELNCADFRGIDTVREMRSRSSLAPLTGSCRIWLLDESHKITGDGQTSLLKLLEDPPDSCYFFLATTEPQKLLKTIHTRCSEIRLSPLPTADLLKLLATVATQEGADLEEEVAEKIVECSEGSARKAIVLLEQVLPISGAEERLECLGRSALKTQAIELARTLMKYPHASWPEVAKILKGLSDEDPEGIRHLILAFSRTALLGGGKSASRAFLMIQCFRDNFYDSKQAGLAAACWEAVHAK